LIPSKLDLNRRRESNYTFDSLFATFPLKKEPNNTFDSLQVRFPPRQGTKAHIKMVCPKINTFFGIIVQ
jgi:hypothetical protein